MKTLFGAAIALTLLASSANAQQAEPSRADSTEVVAPSGVGDFEGLEDELSSALEELSHTLAVLADRIANDPELRVSALRAASTMVQVATVVVEQQSEVVEEALRRAAEVVEGISGEASDEPLD